MVVCCIVYLVPVDVMNPLVSRLPNDSADPQSQVSRHQVHETETGEQAKPEQIQSESGPSLNLLGM